MSSTRSTTASHASGAMTAAVIALVINTAATVVCPRHLSRSHRYAGQLTNARIPAHTSGHIAYYFPTLKAVFTGDTLFIAGCGRVFEGKADTMVASLGRLAALPDDTQVYCGHEYTEKNLQFALTLEPNNPALKAKYEWTRKTRGEGKFTIPSTIGDEKRFNPFLRTDSAELRASLKKIDPAIGDEPVAIFAKTRELKDRF